VLTLNNLRCIFSTMSALERAVEICGGQTGLARACGVKQAHVWNWLRRDKRVSAETAIQIEAATKGAVTREELRPDIFAVPRVRRHD
jgi:DNA-binding transcriptional regulator YdaS (Cro superfamily)